MMKTGQLHTLARDGFKIYRATESTGHVVTFDAGRKPLPMWPDGHWCIEVSHYLTRSARKSLSRVDRGGSLGTYASQLSHVVRYAFANKCDFRDFTDSRFSMFIRGLRTEKVMRNGALERKRDDNSVIAIGRRTLDFLAAVGYTQGVPELVDKDGIIKGYKKRASANNRRGAKRAAQAYWHHDSFPQHSARRIRRPISDDYVAKLRAATSAMPGSSFMRRRRYVMLRCLEKTGGRRIEIANLRVSHILAAVKQAKGGNKPFLQMATFKKRSGVAYRKVPLNLVELNEIVDFIKYYRAPVLSRTGQKHDYVFVNERTGKPLTANTVTTEVQDMRKAAGITGKASPHLFRHKYITDLMKSFIDEFDIPDKNAFLELAKNMASLKERILEYTGHQSAESLETYIDYAFMDRKKMDDIEERVAQKSLAESAERAMNELRRLKASMTPEDFASKAMDVLAALNTELGRGRTKKE